MEKDTQHISNRAAIQKSAPKSNSFSVEMKSRRVQLLLQPSIVERVKSFAKDNGKSMNETINEAIKAYLAEHNR